MNDFTKEELEQLKYHLFGNANAPTQICIKIQSMIDNYCKHEEQSYPLHNATYFTGLCKKCGRKCR